MSGTDGDDVLRARYGTDVSALVHGYCSSARALCRCAYAAQCLVHASRTLECDVRWYCTTAHAYALLSTDTVYAPTAATLRPVRDGAYMSALRRPPRASPHRFPPPAAR
eukprot:695300-Rhodomonas_salina.1